MKTRYPEDGRVELTFKDPKAETLRLRIPSWCERAMIDGHPVSVADGWACVEGDWKNGRTVILDLVMTPKFVKGTGAQASRVAVVCGPRVYGATSLTFRDVRQQAATRTFEYGGHQLLDAAEIRTDRPLVFTNGFVKASFVVMTESRVEQSVSLVPFSAENRERTSSVDYERFCENAGDSSGRSCEEDDGCTLYPGQPREREDGRDSRGGAVREEGDAFIRVRTDEEVLETDGSDSLFGNAGRFALVPF